MTQRYSSPVALDRMSEGLCPECGNAPTAHPITPVDPLNVCGVGGLLWRGVVDRIEQYRADLAPAAAGASVH